MDVTILLFLSSGLFLGWSLGANDAANAFGTAVGSRMIQFWLAAAICGIFVILGAVVSGAGPAAGLGKLGTVNALPGSFMAALTAALTVYWMTRFGLPVSATQAIVGAIIGWNFFSNSITDLTALLRLTIPWVVGPLLGLVFSAVLYRVVVQLVHWSRIHLLWLDNLTRVGLILAGAFAAYSLGANNIANVMGVFVSSSPFQNIDVFGWFTLTPTEQLFLIGGIAISIGVFNSRRVMMTVGRNILPVTPVAAWVVVVAQSLVLFIFSSTELQYLLIRLGLPALPLVPISSSQVVVGALIGIGFARGFKGARQINWSVLVKIAFGWIATPVIAAVVCYFLLFFLQNVFQQRVYRTVTYQLSAAGFEHLKKAGLRVDGLATILEKKIESGMAFRDAVRQHVRLSRAAERRVLDTAEVYRIWVDPRKVLTLNRRALGPERIQAIAKLADRRFRYRWRFLDALARQHASWRVQKPGKPLGEIFNLELKRRLDYVSETFHVKEGK